MIQAINSENEVVELCNLQISLSIPLLALYYNQGLNDSQIATRCNCSQQNVTRYKLKHIEDIKPLVYDRNMYASLDSAYLAQQARTRLKDIIGGSEAFTKRDIIPLVAVTDRLSTQSRLYAGESTQNIDHGANQIKLKDVQAQLQDIKERRMKRIGGTEMGNDKAIEAEYGEE